NNILVIYLYVCICVTFIFFFSSRRRHTRSLRDWSSDVCSSDLRAAKETMEAGNLVGDDIMIAIVQDRISRDDARCGFVLDGFPRTVVQATALDRIVDGRGPLVVLDIVVPEDELVRRLSSRRICGKCGSNAP